jgi:hypothetical protein
MRPEFIAGTATRVGQNRAVPHARSRCMRPCGYGHAATAVRPGHETRPRGHAATYWICLGWAGTGVACRVAARQEEI